MRPLKQIVIRQLSSSFLLATAYVFGIQTITILIVDGHPIKTIANAFHKTWPFYSLIILLILPIFDIITMIIKKYYPNYPIDEFTAHSGIEGMPGPPVSRERKIAFAYFPFLFVATIFLISLAIESHNI